ncbi:hypothetical protein J5277_09690 [Rhizobium sp. 16-449-1b]|nr:hypothetical protein [Rhizobium sp. 16-449-1b]
MSDLKPRYTTKRLHDEIAKATAYGIEQAAALVDGFRCNTGEYLPRRDLVDGIRALASSPPPHHKLVAEVLTVNMDAPLTAVDRLRALAGGSRDIDFEPSDADEILEKLEALAAILSAPNLEFGDEPVDDAFGRKFTLGERVRKTKGSSWQGRIVGFYSTDLTPIGYAVESERETGSVQIYPENALAKLEDQP